MLRCGMSRPSGISVPLARTAGFLTGFVAGLGVITAASTVRAEKTDRPRQDMATAQTLRRSGFADGTDKHRSSARSRLSGMVLRYNFRKLNPHILTGGDNLTRLPFRFLDLNIIQRQIGLDINPPDMDIPPINADSEMLGKKTGIRQRNIRLSTGSYRKFPIRQLNRIPGPFLDKFETNHRFPHKQDKSRS